MLEKHELKKYQESQDELNELKTILKQRQKKFEEENGVLIVDIQELTKAVELTKTDITMKAMYEYEINDLKKLLGGLGIRVGVGLDYASEDALEWAKKHDLCLSLDRKAFEGLAKTQDIDCVSKSEKITVTFPKRIEFEDSDDI